MDSNELRHACELSGLDVKDDHPITGMWYAHDGNHSWMEDDPALPSYVASLLVAKVKGKTNTRLLYVNELWKQVEPAMFAQIIATDEQRIRAAVAVLQDQERANERYICV